MRTTRGCGIVALLVGVGLTLASRGVRAEDLSKGSSPDKKKCQTPAKSEGVAPKGDASSTILKKKADTGLPKPAREEKKKPPAFEEGEPKEKAAKPAPAVQEKGGTEKAPEEAEPATPTAEPGEEEYVKVSSFVAGVKDGTRRGFRAARKIRVLSEEEAMNLARKAAQEEIDRILGKRDAKKDP